MLAGQNINKIKDNKIKEVEIKERLNIKKI